MSISVRTHVALWATLSLLFILGERGSYPARRVKISHSIQVHKKSPCCASVLQKESLLCSSVCVITFLPSAAAFHAAVKRGEEVKRLKSEGRTDRPQARLRAVVHGTVAEGHEPSVAGIILRTRPIGVGL